MPCCTSFAHGVVVSWPAAGHAVLDFLSFDRLCVFQVGTRKTCRFGLGFCLTAAGLSITAICSGHALSDFLFSFFAVSRPAEDGQPLAMDMPFWTFCPRAASVCVSQCLTHRACHHGFVFVCVASVSWPRLQWTCLVGLFVFVLLLSHGPLLFSSPLGWTCRFGLFVLGPLLGVSGESQVHARARRFGSCCFSLTTGGLNTTALAVGMPYRTSCV